jgi:hypothetical protein
VSFADPAPRTALTSDEHIRRIYWWVRLLGTAWLTMLLAGVGFAVAIATR